MKVEIWSDVVCPWCYIGKRRFERALERFDGAADVEIVWRSFQLDPTHPKGLREAHDESLARKLGATVEQVHELNERVVSLAAAEGLEYHFETYVTINTFDAHRVTHLAKALGPGPADPRAPPPCPARGGRGPRRSRTRSSGSRPRSACPRRRPAAVLASDAYTAEVEADIAEAHALGVNGVPFFVIDRRYGISGAQPADLFLQALETARRDAAAVAAAPTS